jgi:hypothetical protein
LPCVCIATLLMKYVLVGVVTKKKKYIKIYKSVFHILPTAELKTILQKCFPLKHHSQETRIHNFLFYKMGPPLLAEFQHPTSSLQLDGAQGHGRGESETEVVAVRWKWSGIFCRCHRWNRWCTQHASAVGSKPCAGMPHLPALLVASAAAVLLHGAIQTPKLAAPACIYRDKRKKMPTE